MHRKTRKADNPKLSWDANSGTGKRTTKEREIADLIPLFRLLARQPPPDHDFRTCPICKRYSIAKI